MMVDRRTACVLISSLAGLAVPALRAHAKELGTVSDPGFPLPAGATDCHVHVFDPARFPYSPKRRYTPPSATVAELLRLHDRLGLQRVVLVQPSVYETDNACLLDGLKQLGPRARGIAVIDRSFSRGQLDDLYGAGVRGVRINLQVAKDADPLSALGKLDDTLQTLGDSPLIVQIFAAMPVLLACAPRLSALRRPVLIDHFGLAQAVHGPQQTGFEALLTLMRSANVWMKLSGPYQISSEAGYANIAPIARTLIAAAPQRVVWGSDWPHTGGAHRPADYKPTDLEPFRDEDDGQALGLVSSWAPTAEAREALLSRNPARLFGWQ